MIRIQPKECIYLKINSKVPGLGVRLDSTKLDLQYHNAFNKKELPDAYERLLLDVVNGEHPAHCFRFSGDVRVALLH